MVEWGRRLPRCVCYGFVTTLAWGDTPAYTRPRDGRVLPRVISHRAAVRISTRVWTRAPHRPQHAPPGATAPPPARAGGELPWPGPAAWWWHWRPWGRLWWVRAVALARSVGCAGLGERWTCSDDAARGDGDTRQRRQWLLGGAPGNGLTWRGGGGAVAVCQTAQWQVLGRTGSAVGCGRDGEAADSGRTTCLGRVVALRDRWRNK